MDDAAKDPREIRCVIESIASRSIAATTGLPMRRFYTATSVSLLALLFVGCAMPPARNPLATWVPSPNHDERMPVLIVLHATEQQSLEQSLDTLRTRNDRGRVSAHYLVARDGRRFQLVADERRAWHAGAGRWGTITSVNAASIGIELENDGQASYTDAQVASLIVLLEDLCARWSIPRTQVIAHADLAPTRKVDPGPQFPWQRLHAAGFGLWPRADAPPAPAGFDPWRALAQIGYPLDDRGKAVRAFHLRFRGTSDEVLDEEDLRILHALTETAGTAIPDSDRDRHAAGTTLHYRRSNQDGSKPERILVHVIDDRRLAVAKMVARCESAALVTAEFDATRGEAIRLVGGRLARDGTQLPQASIDLDGQSRRLDVRIGDPTASASESANLSAAPWRLYDFDFAEFALFGPRAQSDWLFSYAMAWPDDTPPLVNVQGVAHLTWLGTEDSASGRVNRYRIGGGGFGAGGTVTFDARLGHVVEARIAAPNHPGYRDYLLRLERIESGTAAWHAALAAHWAGCPAR